MKDFLLKAWDSVDDFVLEAGRVMVLAAVPILWEAITSGSLDLRLVGGAMILAALRALDRWLHEKDIVKTGLVPF